MAQYMKISATGSVKLSAGKLIGLMFSAATSTPTIAVYNSNAAATSDPILDTFTPVAATSFFFGDNGIFFDEGLYIVIGNTVTVCVIYE